MPTTSGLRGEGRSPIEEIFTFGLWGGSGPKPYTLGFEGFLREMRRCSMNCLLYAPEVGEGPEGTARLKHHVALCRRYGVYAVPHGGGDLSRLGELARTFGDEPSVLGWYIRDEPPPEFLPEFLECKKLLDEIAPRQPAVCLFYRPDSVLEFAPHQPVMLTDCYPFGYMHDGVSLGPHFAIKDGPHTLARGMGRFNPWGRRGVLEWMDLCRTLCGDLPHWITLQTFESGDGRQVRWREPTAPEMRLQTYLAVAGGAKGINYFHYMHSTDAYGNPRPALHGEETPLLEEIARLGAELTPLGPLFVESEVAEPLTLVASLRPTPDPGERVEVRRLRSKSRDVDYLVAFNDDVQVSSSAQINLSRAFLHGRALYDLRSLERMPTEELPGALAAHLALKPGDGRIFAVASEEDYESDARTILAGRCRNEAAIAEMDYELAEKSRVNLGDAAPLQAQYRERMETGEYADALTRIRRCARAVEKAMRQEGTLWAAKQDLEHAKRTLGRLSGAPGEYQERLSAAYVGLLGLFWEGDAAIIAPATAHLRELVDAAAEHEPSAQTDEQSLRAVEQVARRYQPE